MISNLDLQFGRYHSLVMTAHGEVWSWGENDMGQLGTGCEAQGHGPYLPSNVSSFSKGELLTFSSTTEWIGMEGVDAAVAWWASAERARSQSEHVHFRSRSHHLALRSPAAAPASKIASRFATAAHAAVAARRRS